MCNGGRPTTLLSAVTRLYGTAESSRVAAGRRKRTFNGSHAEPVSRLADGRQADVANGVLAR